jgi:uroporphyrinogen decarboxylase
MTATAAPKTTGRFRRALAGEPLDAPPIWLMRQAGRYQAPYQQMRARHSFEELCRVPSLAAEVAMAPIRDFDFDAAILFSDLLFPLEALGFGLSYADGPPRLDGSLTRERLAAFRTTSDALARLMFQADALALTRARLSSDKGLIGFVGGPWTLFVYAMEGTHAGALASAKASLDLYRAFADRLVPLLVENIRIQLEAGADVVMVFDTAAGELPPAAFTEHLAADLDALASAFPQRLGYYAKNTRGEHFRSAAFDRMPWAGLGLDTSADLAAALKTSERRRFVQGNFDPQSLLLTGAELEAAIDAFLQPIRQLDASTRRGWIAGLGHGVLPPTPESSVRTFVARVREAFA